MNILGINAFHGDSSAALVRDGRLVAAVEEERFNRIKHWAGFPAESIRFCLQAGGIEARDLDHVALSFDPSAHRLKKMGFVLKNRPSIQSLLSRARRRAKSRSLRDQLAEATGTAAGDLRAAFHNIQHHDAHLATAFLMSHFDDAAILSIDGMGDFVSTVLASGRGADWQVLDRVFYPHSLGFLYNAVTLYLGFPHYGDEYKVMGLAPYGRPRYLDAFREMIFPKGDTFELNLDYFTHHRDGIMMSWDDGAPTVEPFHSDKLEQVLGPPRRPDQPLEQHHEDVAASLQRVTEEIVLHVVQALHRRTGKSRLCMAGGVAMNSVANGKILSETGFEQLYVPIGAADNGTAFGAALDLWCRQLGQPRQFVLDHAYWGNRWSDQAVVRAAEDRAVTVETFGREQLLQKAVEAICAGQIVGWFQGAMEFGARALGNRSLLADPRRADMREIINTKIKFRERFRPFAPSILEEYVDQYFETPQPSPFMERVLPIRADKRAEIPAVTHVDGSGRLQTVSRRTNPLYWELIERFRQRTGVPILLNTSLNENEPIVRTPAEAIDCFLRTSMDLIIVEHTVIRRAATASQPANAAALRVRAG